MGKLEKIKAKDRSFKQWFKFLPAKLRQKAIFNAKNCPDPVDLNMVVPFSWAIRGSFTWINSPEGLDFWIEVNQEWLNGDFLPKCPMFKVGDRVYSKEMGLGVVVPNEYIRPIGHISVDFGESGTMVFGEDGLMLSRPGNHEDYRVHRITHMEKFALQLLRVHAHLSPHQLAHDWSIIKGTRRPVSPRHAFGGTSAGYRTLRSLESKGILVCHNRKRPFYSLATQEA